MYASSGDTEWLDAIVEIEPIFLIDRRIISVYYTDDHFNNRADLNLDVTISVRNENDEVTSKDFNFSFD